MDEKKQISSEETEGSPRPEEKQTSIDSGEPEGQKQTADDSGETEGKKALPEKAGRGSRRKGRKEKGGSFVKGIFTGVLATLLILALILGISVYSAGKGDSAVNPASYAKLMALEKIIKRCYYQDVDKDAMEKGMYKGIMEAMGDPYTEYYTAREYEDLMASMTGSFVGIGVSMTKTEDGKIKVVTVYDKSPAREAGMVSGDIIEKVGDQSTADLSLEDIVAKVRGQADSRVELTLRRADGREETLSVARRRIEIPSVSHRMAADGIGYVRIDQFSENTLKEYLAAMDDLKKQGMKGVIFDVRNNPGGMVTSVTDILNHILPEGTSVYMVDKEGKRTDYHTDGRDELKMPIAVLISKDSASAAEIFAGAIRDYHKGTLIGQTTFGKGIVQQTMRLADGSAVKITVSSYYTPNGESIHRKGIQPDVSMEDSDTKSTDTRTYDILKDNEVGRAIEILRDQLR